MSDNGNMFLLSQQEFCGPGDRPPDNMPAVLDGGPAAGHVRNAGLQVSLLWKGIHALDKREIFVLVQMEIKLYL